jgi:hypothetical protein
MTKEELKEYCDSEFKNIDRVMEELFLVYRPEKSNYTLTEQAAMATFLVNIYSGFEKVLKQVLIYDKLDIKDSPEWHEKVLKKADEIGILPPDFTPIISKYLSFRNHFLYTYIFNIKWDDVKVLLEALRDVVARFRSEVDEYIQII